MRVIAYAYDADHHCEGCMLEYASKVPFPEYDWQGKYNDNDIMHDGQIDYLKAVELQIIRDSEGNPIHPVFDIDEWYAIGQGNQSLVCSDCSGMLDSYYED